LNRHGIAIHSSTPPTVSPGFPFARRRTLLLWPWRSIS
jgi:hypothetical protein